MASEFELVAKQKKFIIEIPDYVSASENQCVSLIKNFCLATISISDAFFVFPVVDLYNRILISSETDEVRAKREPSLCNESVKRHFW